MRALAFVLVLVVIVPHALAGSPEIRTEKDVYAPNERIVVVFKNARGISSDWITVVPKETPEKIDAGVKRKFKVRTIFVQRRRNGSFTLEPREPDQYEARYYARSGVKVLARYSFTVWEPVPVEPLIVRTDKQVYGPNEKIVVQWKNLPGNPRDTITVRKRSEAPNSGGSSARTRGAKDGSFTFSRRPVGEYEARLQIDGRRRIAASYPFVVSAISLFIPPAVKPDKMGWLGKTRDLAAQCKVLQAWAGRMDEEYPEFKNARSYYPRYSIWGGNLFRDDEYVRVFGRTYADTDASAGAQILNLIRLCRKAIKGNAQNTLRRYAGKAFKAGFAERAKRDLVEQVRRIREILKWTESVTEEIKTLPPTDDGFARIQEIYRTSAEKTVVEIYNGEKVALIWPRERQALLASLKSRRNTLAAAIARKRIATYPTKLASLEKIDVALDFAREQLNEENPGELKKLQGIADARTQSIVRTVFEDYQERIQGLPVSFDGARTVEQNFAAIASVLQRFTPEWVPAFATARDERVTSVHAQLFNDTLDKIGRIGSTWRDVSAVISQMNVAASPFASTALARRAATELLQAAFARVQYLASKNLSIFREELDRIPVSFEGARLALAKFRSIKPNLEQAAATHLAAYEDVAFGRIETILETLLREIRKEIQSPKGGWREAPGIIVSARKETAAFDGTRVQDKGSLLVEVAAARADAIAKNDFARFRREAASVKKTWAGLKKLDELAVFVEKHQQQVPAFKKYARETVIRQSEILDALAEAARRVISATGSTYRDVTKVIQTGERHARRFDLEGAPARASLLRRIAASRAVTVVKEYFPNFVEEIAELEATRQRAAELETRAEEFGDQSERFPAFRIYQQAALARSQTIIEAICEMAVKRAGFSPADEQEGILAGDRAMSLRDFVCGLDENGNQVSELAAPGSLEVKDGYTMKVFESNGQFVYAKLRKVEALPGKNLLVGFALGDANQQQDITVNEWRTYVAALLGQRSPKALSAAVGSGTQEIAARLQRSVAFVVWQNQTSFISGTGFFISPTLLVTNQHVVDGAAPDKIFVTSEALGKVRIGKIMATSNGNKIGTRDYALVSFGEPLPIDPLVISANVASLARVVTAGYPGFLTKNDPRRGRLLRGDSTAAPSMIFSAGEVSVTQASPSGIPLIVHTAEISQGNSGGPLVDLCGRVVGVNTFFASDNKSNRVAFNSLGGSDLIKFLREKGADGFQTTEEPCTR